MSFDRLLNKSVIIERSTAGSENEWGQPARTFSDLATVRARIDPQGQQREGGEDESTHGGGSIIREFKIFMRPTDITTADMVRDGSHRYEVERIEEYAAASPLHHLEVLAQLVEPASG